jgi:iron(III) transport system ATP-binding protein
MLQVTDLTKEFAVKGEGEDVRALDGVSLSVGAGEFFTLLGPSGCGKTTTLRCIAGLESPTGGEILVDGKTFYSSARRVDVPANRRGLGMVFQSYAIWPHMDVAANVAFPLKSGARQNRLPSAEIERKVDEALEKVELSHVKKRRATALSGGQQQRLALARALVMQTPLTLFDEPLSNLDAKLRDGMRFELKRLQRKLGLTAIYVTHDQVEALAMSSRIAIMRDGRIEQLGKPREIYEKPASLFVADFIGTSNFIPGVIKERGPMNSYVVGTAAGELRAEVGGTEQIAVGTSVTVSIRPQHLRMEKEPASVPGVGRWAGVVRTRAYLGEYIDHVVEVNGIEMRVRVDPRISLVPDTEVTLTIDPLACALLPEG